MNRCLIALVIPLCLAGCTSVSVKKPQVASIKKIAIVSLFLNRRVTERSGKGLLVGWTESDQKALADQTLLAFQSEISSTLSWDVYPADKILSEPTYMNNFKPYAEFGKTPRQVASNAPPSFEPPPPEGFITGAGMLPIFLDDQSIAKVFGRGDPERMRVMMLMGNFAAQLQLDGVAVVQIDLSYRYRKNKKGKYEAVGSAASSLVVIDKRGNRVVDMEVLAPGSDLNRKESKSAMPIYQSELTFKGLAAEEIHGIFLEAIRGSAQECITRIKRAVN